MRVHLQTARHQHAVSTPAQLEQRQLTALHRLSAATGDRLIPWTASRPLVAYVSAGAWVGDCDCGAGVATDPQWRKARCFACGAVYETRFPPDVTAIVDLLERRPRAHQHWRPQDGETAATLAAENAAHGID